MEPTLAALARKYTTEKQVCRKYVRVIMGWVGLQGYSYAWMRHHGAAACTALAVLAWQESGSQSWPACSACMSTLHGSARMQAVPHCVYRAVDVLQT